jgi:hypothetical protein
MQDDGTVDASPHEDLIKSWLCTDRFAIVAVLGGRKTDSCWLSLHLCVKAYKVQNSDRNHVGGKLIVIMTYMYDREPLRWGSLQV